MKRKSMIIVLGVLLLFFVGCLPDSTTKNNMSENCVRLTDTTFYYKISGLLYTADATNFWHDIQYLKDTEVRTIEIYLDSGGGDPYVGFAYVDIINKAKELGFTVNIRAYGLVMSAVVPIMVSGSNRSSGEHTAFMVHMPYLPEYIPYGYPAELWEFVKQSYSSTFAIYAKIIAEYTNLSLTEVKKMIIVRGVYFNAYEALEMGFIDEIV